MSITIASCLVKSELHGSFPNGDLVASGIVNHYDNTNSYNEYTQTLIKKVSVVNSNFVHFFGKDRTEYSASALRAIAYALIELADRAEEAHTKLIELNQTK